MAHQGVAWCSIRGTASSARSNPSAMAARARDSFIGIGQGEQEQGDSRSIAQSADGLSHLVAGKQVRVVQVNHQGRQQSGIVREAKDARRCGPAGRDRGHTTRQRIWVLPPN